MKKHMCMLFSTVLSVCGVISASTQRSSTLATVTINGMSYAIDNRPTVLPVRKTIQSELINAMLDEYVECDDSPHITFTVPALLVPHESIRRFVDLVITGKDTQPDSFELVHDFACLGGYFGVHRSVAYKIAKKLVPQILNQSYEAYLSSGMIDEQTDAQKRSYTIHSTHPVCSLVDDFANIPDVTGAQYTFGVQQEYPAIFLSRSGDVLVYTSQELLESYPWYHQVCPIIVTYIFDRTHKKFLARKRIQSPSFIWGISADETGDHVVACTHAGAAVYCYDKRHDHYSLTQLLQSTKGAAVHRALIDSTSGRIILGTETGWIVVYAQDTLQDGLRPARAEYKECFCIQHSEAAHITALSLAAQKKLLVAGSGNGELAFYAPAETGGGYDLIQAIDLGIQVRSFAISDDGGVCACCLNDGTLIVYTYDAEHICFTPIWTHMCGAVSVALSLDGNRLYVGCRDSVEIYERFANSSSWSHVNGTPPCLLTFPQVVCSASGDTVAYNTGFFDNNKHIMCLRAQRDVAREVLSASIDKAFSEYTPPVVSKTSWWSSMLGCLAKIWYTEKNP